MLSTTVPASFHPTTPGPWASGYIFGPGESMPNVVAPSPVTVVTMPAVPVTPAPATPAANSSTGTTTTTTASSAPTGTLTTSSSTPATVGTTTGTTSTSTSSTSTITAATAGKKKKKHHKKPTGTGTGTGGLPSGGTSGASGGTSGSGSTGTGSTGTGSTGTGSTGTGSTGTGSSGSGTGVTPNIPNPPPTPTPSNPNDPATPVAVITVTSPSEVLPLESINVQAVDSNFGSGTALNSTINWDFGDPGSSYNNLVGFSAAHAYANPGTYSVTLSITTPDGHTGVSTTSVTIDPDNRSAIYVSNSGSDGNNGSSPNQAIQTIGRLNQLLSSNTRVLFQSGGTYNIQDYNSGVNVSNLQHIYIGSYGSGSQPVLYYTGAANTQLGLINMSSTSSGIVVQGISFDSIFTNNGDSEAIPSGIFPQGNDITVMDDTFLNLQNDLNLEGGPSNVLIQDNTSPNPTGLNSYFTWIQGSEIAVIGNTVANSNGEAILRVGGASDVLIAYNNFTNNVAHDKNCMSIQWGTYGYIYGNTLTNGPLMVGPIGVDGSATNASFQDCVIDSNTLNNDDVVINPEAIDTVVENNVINRTNAYGIAVNSTETGGGFNWQVQNLWIMNNTVIESGTDGGFLLLQNGESQNIVMDNNLFVGPNYDLNAENAYVYNSNDDMNSFSEIKNNVWGTPAAIDWWNLGGMFFVGSNPAAESGWLTPAEWESIAPATGDVYMSVSLTNAFSVSTNGFTAGSSMSAQ